MWQAPGSGSQIGLSPAAATSNVYNAASNHKTNESYDGSGNQTSLGGIYSLSYDAENRQVTESNNIGNPNASYVYDGQGQRVEKVVGGSTTVFVYDALGQLAAEYANAPTGTPPCQTCYPIQDYLGTTRLVTDGNANVVAFHDFLPFGEEVPGNTAGRSNLFGASDSVNQKFTGQYRDTENGNDFFNARYYASGLGRLLSPDPGNAGADPSNPQSWNAYSYVLNNPLSMTDPSGLDPFDDGGGDGCDGDPFCDWWFPFPIPPIVGGGGGSGNGGTRTGSSTPTPATLPGSTPLPPNSFPGGETAGLPPGLRVPAPFGIDPGCDFGVCSGGVDPFGFLPASGLGGVLVDGCLANPVCVALASTLGLGAYIFLKAEPIPPIRNPTVWKYSSPFANIVLAKRANDFTRGTKARVDANNAAANEGNNACECCGTPLKKIASQKGIPTPPNQLQRHHKIPLSQGGPSTEENCEVLCPDCHSARH